MKLIDWQLSRYSPSVLDLLYSSYGATTKEFRAKYWKELIDVYYSSLCSITRRLGSDPEKLYTFSDFNDQLKKFGKYGLIFSINCIHFYSCTADLNEFSKSLREDENNVILYGNIADSKMDAYAQAINDAVTDMFDLDYIQL